MMNEELDGLVSLGIERGRDFPYISNILKEEGYSEADIKLAEQFYNQKKKSQSDSISASKPAMDSSASGLGGPRVGKSGLVSGFSEAFKDVQGQQVAVQQASVVANEREALGAIQFGLTGKAPLSYQQEKLLVAKKEKISAEFDNQKSQSAKIFLANKEAGNDPYQDPEFQAAKQKENEFVEQGANVNRQLHPELPEDVFVAYNDRGEARETPLSEAKYLQSAIKVVPGLQQDIEFARIQQRKQAEDAVEVEEFRKAQEFGNIPIVSKAANGALAVASGFTDVIASVASFITEPFAGTTDEYEGIIPEVAQSIYESAKFTSSAMRQQRGVNLENYGLTQADIESDPFTLIAEGNLEAGYKSLAIMVADASLFSRAIGALYGIGGVAAKTQLGQTVLATGKEGAQGVVNNLSRNVATNVADSPIMFGAMATLSAQQSWDAVKERDDLTISEKLFYQSVGIAANTLTEALNVDDLRLVSKGLPSAQREIALKSFRGTLKNYFEDVAKVGAPEAFEETLNFYADAFAKYVIDGELPAATDALTSIAVGFLAPSLNVTATYAPAMIETALATTPWKMAKTKEFERNRQLAAERGRIVETLANENLPQNEKRILQKALNNVETAIEDQERKDFEFYSGMEYADANEILNIHGAIGTKAQQYKKTRSKELRAVLEAEIRGLYGRKVEIENRYDGTKKTGISSSVFEGQTTEQARTDEGAGQETIKASGVLQVSTEEGPEVTVEQETIRQEASKSASEEFSVGSVVPGRVITEPLARVMNNIFGATKAVVRGGKVRFHYSQESIADANEVTRSKKAKNPKIFFDGFYDRTNKVFHVYIPTAADSAKVVKQEDGKYALVDPKFGGQVIKTYDDRTTAFQAKQRYDENYIQFATSKARHEAIHPVIDALILEDKPILDEQGNQVVNNVGEKQFAPNSFRQFLYDNIVSLYSSSADAQRIFDNFLDPYIQSGATSATMQREAITEFLAAMADEKKFKQLDRGFVQKVKDIVNELLVRAGIRDISISTDDDLYTVARAFKTAMALGVEVKVQKGGWKNYTPVGEVFSVDMLDGLKASGFTEKRLRGIITAGKFGMLTGQNPRGTRFPEEVREKFNREAEAWLKSRGYEAIPILGKFEGIAENSFLVPNLTADDALLFARQFNQEAVAHNSGFIHFDGSFEPRIPDNNVFGVKYEDPDSDYFSALRTKDGKLTAFKVDYNFDLRLNYRALEDGLTNQIDFSISIPEGQTYAEFFDSVGDQSMRAQATMLQLLAEKVGYSKPILFSTKGTTSFDATKDYTIFNVAEDRELNESFGYFANALSTIISKENMGLYRSLLDETKRNFPELVEAKGKEASLKFLNAQGEADTVAMREQAQDAGNFFERLAIKAALDEKMVEFFKTNETDFEALRKNWETNKKLIGSAINVDITDIVPNMKIDGVMEILASPTRDIYAATEVATRLKREALGAGGMALTLDEARASVQELQNVAAVVGQDAVVVANGFVVSKDLVDDLALVLVEVGKTKDGTSTFNSSQNAESAQKGRDLIQKVRNIDYNELYDITRGFWAGTDLPSPEYVRDSDNTNFDAEVEKFKSSLEDTVNNLKDIAGNTLRGSNIRKALDLIDEYNSRILTEIESALAKGSDAFSSYKSLHNSYNDIIFDAKDFFADEFNRRINDPRRLMNMSIRSAIIEISDLDTFTIEDAKAYIATELSDASSHFSKINISDVVYADIDGYSIGGAMYTLSPDVKYVRLREFIGNDNLSSVISSYGQFNFRLGDIIGEANSAISRRTVEAGKATRYRLPEGNAIASARIEVFIPKLNDTYVVTGTYYNGDVGVAFNSTTTGYDLKDPGAALSVMPEVIKAISRMFPERDVKSISFSPIETSSAKRSGGELRRGVYRMFAQRLFGNYFPVGVTSDNDNVIPIPYTFRSTENTRPVYEDMANKQINRDRNIDFAISNFENIPAEVTQGLNSISNAVAFASQSSFANKLLFKDELQNRFKSYEKELKKKYGMKSFKVGGKSKAVDAGLKNYLVDAYVYETLVAIQAYPDALGWYDYKTRAAMEVMSLIHPELKTDPMAAVAFKIALAITSNGNKVFDNFKEADRQYEYFKNNGKFDNEKSIGTQSAGIKSTLNLVNNVLDRMTMEEFNSFLTSKFRAGDLKYISKGKSKTLLSGFNVNTEVYGASIFGPKIGNGFFMNLNGQFDQLTMDRWFMRQFGRLTGTLIERDANKIANGKVRLKGAITALSSKEKSILSKVIPGFAKMSVDERATAINKVSIVKEKRDMLSSTDALNELRKAGNTLAKNLSGEVEAPNGGTQRDFIIDVFNEAQKELKEKYGIDITIADLQAVNWYPEKALYQTFQEGRDEEDGSVETSDNEQPDYESAAVKLAQERGVTNQKIENARARTNSGERAAEANGRRAELISGDNVQSSVEEIRRKILSVKAGAEQEIDFSISWFESPEGKGDPTISRRDPQLEEAARELRDGKITNEEFKGLIKLLSPIEKISKFFEPASQERMASALSKDKVPSLNAKVREGQKVALRLDIPAYINSNTWVVSVHDGNKKDGKVVSYQNVARITDVEFKSNPLAALNIAAGADKSTIGRMFGNYAELKGATPEARAESAKAIIEGIWKDQDWIQIGMNPTRASYFYDRANGAPVVGAEEVVQIGGLVYAKNPRYTRWDDPQFQVKGYTDAAGAPVSFSLSTGAPKFEVEGKKIRGFAERMADSNIQLYSDIIENPENYYTPQTLEEIQSQLAIMTIPELLDKMTTDKVGELSGTIKVDLTDEDNISVLLGAELIKRYSAEGDDAKLLEMIERMSKMGTTVGRMLRHFGEIKNATHIGIVQTVVAMAQRAGRRLTDTQITKLNTLAQELFALQVEGKDMMLEALRAPSTALDKAIKEKETQLKTATKKLDDFISTAVPKSAQDIFGGLIKGNLLTPVSQVVNVFANLSNVFTRQFLVNPPAVLIDAVRAFATGKPREITPSIAAFFFGVKRAGFVGIPEAIEYIFKGTRPTEETFQYESRQGFLPIQAMIAALSDTKVANAINKAVGKEVIKPDQLARLEDGSISFSDRLKKITEGTFGIAPEVMFRLLTLGDRPFARFQEGIEIYRRGKKLGLRGDALDNFIKHPDPATIKAAREAGREITYQADTSFSTTVQSLLNIVGKSKLGNFLTTIIVPYSKTPSNIIYDTLNYVAPPVAILRAVKAAKDRRFDQFATLLGKSFVGFTIYALADFLVKNGLATAGVGDDEKKEKEMFYSLFPYNSINLSGLRRYINGEDTSLQSDDVFVDYSKAGPIGAIIGARAAYWSNKDTKPVSVAAEAENYGEMATMYLGETIGTTMSSFQFMAQQSFLANTNQILELLTTKGDIEPDYILNSLFKTTSAAILPNTLTALNRATRAKLPDLYDKNSLYNSLTNVIKDRTFNTDGIPAKFNIWGDAVDQTPVGADPILYNLFDPIRYQKRQYRPEQLEVFRLYEDLGQDTKVIPTIPRELMSRKFKDTETEIEYTFTNEEVNAMMEKLGKDRSKAMAELIKEDWYKSYSDEDKAYELEYLYKDISKNGDWKQMLYNFMEKAKQENRIKE